MSDLNPDNDLQEDQDSLQTVLNQNNVSYNEAGVLINPDNMPSQEEQPPIDQPTGRGAITSSAKRELNRSKNKG